VVSRVTITPSRNLCLGDSIRPARDPAPLERAYFEAPGTRLGFSLHRSVVGPVQPNSRAAAAFVSWSWRAVRPVRYDKVPARRLSTAGRGSLAPVLEQFARDQRGRRAPRTAHRPDRYGIAGDPAEDVIEFSDRIPEILRRTWKHDYLDVPLLAQL
jgi:hypothetical protein